MNFARFLAAMSAMWVVALAPPSSAVVIRDDVWQERGGSKGDWSTGFDLAVALAAEPQFASVLAIYREDGGQFCSGTWIGNGGESGNAFVLTGAHCFGAQIPIGELFYVTDQGTQLVEIARTIHPLYDPDAEDISGYYDLAVVELSGPIEDSGAAPVLYAGSDEHDREVTLVGYGTRGTGSYGATDDFKDAEDYSKAAARNTVNPFRDFLKNENGTQFLSVTLDMPDNPEGKAVDELQGISGPGDSGGSLWMKTAKGWRIVGVAASSFGAGVDDKPVYGVATTYFARMSEHIDFVQSVFADAAVGE